jgi:hypothetical protein
MHQRGLISFPFARELRTFWVRTDFGRRERAKSKLGILTEMMFVVCLLLRFVKQIRAAFLDDVTVLAI